MVETVTARASHYDVLGVDPSASSDEIARAFAREMGRPRPFGGLADVSIAYEVLRNPDRRRAYDEAIGLAQAKPESSPEPFRRPMALHARPQFIASPLPRAEAKPEQVAEEPKVEPAPVEKPSEASLPPFFANALRDIAAPAPLPKRKAEPSTPMPRQVIEPMFGDDSSAPWKKVAVPAGIAIAAVALLGALAGWQSRSDPTTAAEKAQAALLTPPPMTTYSVNDPVEKAQPQATVLDQSAILASPAAAKRPSYPSTTVAKKKHPSRLADVEQQLAPPSVADTAQAEATPQAAELQPAKPAAASLPLPNSVIARTISRIGYPCGSVASTSAGGSPGVFTVTCTSGHSYKAAPVHGRYHFSRLRD
jgi:hypothetical protein